MATQVMSAPSANGTASSGDLFALTDEQILQIEPDAAQDVEVFGGERTDTHDPLREDLDLLSPAKNTATNTEGNGQIRAPQVEPDTKVAAATANSQLSPATVDSLGAAPAWLAERMNDPQNGAEARALWDGAQTARQEASAFREVFAKPEDARAAAERAKTLDDFDRAYFGMTGSAPEQLSASAPNSPTKCCAKIPPRSAKWFSPACARWKTPASRELPQPPNP